MRIAFVTAHMSGQGGVEILLKTLVPGLVRKGHEVTTWLPERSDDSTWESRVNARYFVGEESPEDRRLIGVDGAWGQAVCLQKKWRDDMPEVVVAAAPYLCAVTRVAAGHTRPRPPIVSWVQASLRAFPGSAHLIGLADAHVAIGKGLYDEVRRTVGSGTIYLVRNGVSLHVEILRRPSIPTFLYVGRLANRQKRLDKLFYALQGLTALPWQVKIVGDGPDRSLLQELANQLGMGDRIHWLGFQDNPFDAAGEATALVLPSDWEGFGLVLVEALAHGIPVIASHCPVGPAEIVQHGVNGWLFPPQDIVGLRRVLEGIIRESVALPSADTCRASVQHYSDQTMIDEFDRALTSLVAQGPHENYRGL
ncbi:glycosyltransferase [Sulfobacillus thermosulfidooxidans]|uniref:glycosyltransferase n=1 Tax=Sulfobacillus thermosulfidooxidans TaxID=28034 RepID=UPI0006B499CB|nr:glycosyltransferase [Sulfobacillus thermosulfidooxidans]